MRALPILLLLAGSAYADRKAPRVNPPAPAPAPAAAAPLGPHPEGEYWGVEPGHGPKAESGKKQKPPPKGTLAWVGFEAKGGGSELFFQSVAAFEVNQHLENGTLVIDLGGLSRLGHNTWRQLDTRFFDTPISRIVAGYGTGKHGNVQVRVTFKNAKDPVH